MRNFIVLIAGCDLLKIHYLCGDKDNDKTFLARKRVVVICSKFITFAVTKTTCFFIYLILLCCDLLKIHYLCGDKDNKQKVATVTISVVICSKFITFAVTKTTQKSNFHSLYQLWFAQNSLPLRWQRQRTCDDRRQEDGCDLLKIHYLCGDKDNWWFNILFFWTVVICSKFITFAVTKTTTAFIVWHCGVLWFAQNSLPLRWQRQQNICIYNINVCCDLLKIHYLCGDKDN